jgi:hypothetical protein
MENTDCTIPYTIKPATVTSAPINVNAGMSYASVTNVVFGTPGQIGKVNLRVKVTGNFPTNNVAGLAGGAAIAIIRTA